MSANRPLIAATRDSQQLQLQVKSGTIPNDWYGHVFINSPAGSVNSNGLPFPQDTQETGSPIMNGDGYVFRIDLNPGQASLQTELVKPACYYADVATKEGNANQFGKLFGFENWGMTRMSLELGSRNELNTAITPFQFQGDSAPRLLACYDAGRPWEIDPVNLETITPIGANSEWVASTPAKAFPFGIVQSTAHPSFDPVTKEMFFVNFTKSIHTVINNDEVMELIKKDESLVKQSFQNIINRIHNLTDTGEILQVLKQHLLEPVVEEEHKIAQWLHGIFHHGHLHRDQTNTQIEGITTNAASLPATPPSNPEEDAVYLLRWNGESAPLQKWKVQDQNGKPVKIIQCMHQTTITQDYIILADATFKFSLDLLFNHPFSDTKIDNFLRKFLTVQQLPYLDVYIIARADLNPSNDTITCKKLQQPIPLEAVHFTANYSNPNGMVTLHLAHNSAACLAEWVRTYDTMAPDGKTAPNPEVVGLISVGDMDIGRIGKVVIDAKTATIVSQNYIIEKGNLDHIAQIGAHTWGVGLYTFRDIISANTPVNEINHIYWSCYGLDPRLLTKFMYDLYTHYENRIIPVETMLSLTQQGIPFVLSRQNVSTMTLEDAYTFPANAILKSIQFVPKSGNNSLIDPQMNGYIFTTEVVNYPNADGDNYLCEIWIFDAGNLQQGPICVLNHPELNYAFTLHSAWTATIGPSPRNYKINIREDYDPLIKQLEPAFRQPQIQQLFNQFVYPPFHA